MYEPDTITEFNENKKYILAGYDDIPEEKDNDNNSEIKESDKIIMKENYNNHFNYKNNLEDTSFSNNIQNIKKTKYKYDINNKNKNSFFDEYSNNKKDNNNKMKTLNFSTNIKNNMNSSNYIYPQNNQDKIEKRKMNNNILSKTINENININNKKDLSENNSEKDEIINEQDINNEDKNNKKDNSLSLNSIKDENNIERKRSDENLKDKKIKKHKKPYRDSLAQNNMQLREINVRFILTKEEYSILMREKAKNQDFFS
jgi:hypothetical protein